MGRADRKNLKKWTVFLSEPEGDQPGEWIYHVKARHVAAAEKLAVQLHRKHTVEDLTVKVEIEAVYAGWIVDCQTNPDQRWAVNEWGFECRNM